MVQDHRCCFHQVFWKDNGEKNESQSSRRFRDSHGKWSTEVLPRRMCTRIEGTLVCTSRRNLATEGPCLILAGKD